MPSNSVGGVSVTVRLDDKDALQQLERLRRKIQQTQDDLSRKRAQRDAISAEMEQAEIATERARQKVERLKEALAKAAPSDRAGIRAQLTEANAELRQQMSTMDRLNRQWQKLDSDITAGEGNLRRMTADADTLGQQVRSSSGAFAHLHDSARRAVAGIIKAFARVGRMIRRVFVFTVILRALRALREALNNLLLSFPEIREALADIKSNLLTAFTPLFNAVLPYLQMFLNLLVNISAVLADIMAKVFNTTAAAAQLSAKALRDQAAAYKAAGSAASKAGKQFASFDQINQLGSNSGGSAAAATAPTFSTNFEGLLSGQLEGIELLVGEALLAVGAVLTFGGFNIPLGVALMVAGAASAYAALQGDPEALKRSLEGPVGDIMLLMSWAALAVGAILAFSGANIAMGIALMAVGASAIAAQAALNWEALKKKIKGPIGNILAIASGAILALGVILAVSGNLPLGIALIALGAAGLVTVATLKWTELQTALRGSVGRIVAIVSGALLALGAVLAFSGVALPLGIALMVAGAAGLATVTALNWQTVQEALRGPIGEVVAIASGALLALGAILAFSGVALPLGIALMVVGAAGLATVTALNWQTIQEALQGPVGEVVAIASGALLVLGIILAFSGVALPLGIALIAAGAAGLVSVGALNWGAIKDKVTEVWDSITQWWREHVAPIFTQEWWADKFSSIKDGLVSKITDGINAAISLFNRFIDWINDKLHISWNALNILGLEVIPAGDFQLLSIPKIPLLAQGAVIPPNREFMAVLGDQPSGTNIEAPLDTIVQAFRQALGERGGAGSRTVVLQVDKHELGRVTFDAYNTESQRVGLKLGGSLT